MSNEIQKHDSENKPEKATHQPVNGYFKKPFFLTLLAALLGGLAMFAASGYVKGLFANIIMFAFVSFLAVVFFRNPKIGLNKREQRIGITICIVVFAIVSGHPFITSPPNVSNDVESIPTHDNGKVAINSDSLQKVLMRDDSLQKIQAGKVVELKTRPRILLEPAYIRQIRTGQRLEIEIPHISNEEATAYNIRHRHCIKIGGTGIYDADWDSVKAADNFLSMAEPKTRAAFTFWGDQSLTQRDSIGIMNGSRKLFIFGFVDYTDKTGKNKYYRKYCFKYDPKLDAFIDYGACNDAN